MLWPFFATAAILAASHALPQSNYADQANNIGYIGEGLPPQATLGGKVTQLDDLSPEINLNKTKADLNCAAGSMQIELKFKEPFYGTAYADFDRNSACQVSGNGGLKYALEFPLKGCGTQQNPQRVFTNNIVVRFHPGLEMDGDEIITVVCRYPPPIVMEPETQLFRHEEVIAPRESNHLSPLPILLIICGILFLSLFLLGLAASYLCLRRRPMTVFRTITPSESDIEKLSLSSLTVAPIHDSSGSEYPGESPSEIEEHAVVHENGSFSSDQYDYAQEQQVEQVTARPSTIPRLPIAVKEDSPKFNVQVKVRRPPPPSPPSSFTDSRSTRSEISFIPPAPIEEEVLEVEEPVQTMAVPMPMVHHPEITQHFVDDVYLRTIQEKKIIEDIDRRKRQVTEYHTKPKALPPQHWDVTIKNYPIEPQPPQWEDFSDISSASGLSVTPKPQRHMSLPPQPQIDDNKIPLSSPELVGLIGQQPPIIHSTSDRSIVTPIPPSERRFTTQPPPPERRATTQPPSPERSFISRSPADRFVSPPSVERFVSPPPAERFVSPAERRVVPSQLPSDRWAVTSDLTTRTTETAREVTESEEWLRIFNIPKENPQVPNWSVLIRVLQPIEPEETHVIETAETFNSQLTMTDRMKWRQIITTESTLKTLLTEATVREDFERISRDDRFENVFEPPKWNVIIRILSPEDIGPDQKYYYPRRGSLPTLLEYDSEDASSIREPQLYPSSVYRRSFHRSEADLRSMSEMTVDFGKSYHDSGAPSQMVPESPRMSLNRSLSQPSLGRSISEFTDRDRWLMPDAPSEFGTTPEQTPRLQRSPKIKGFHLPRVRLDSGSSSRDGQAESAWQSMESSRVAQTPGGTTTQEMTREVRGATRAKWGRPSQPGSKGWFPDSGSESSFK